MRKAWQSGTVFQVCDREDAIASTRDARAPQKQKRPAEAGAFEIIKLNEPASPRKIFCAASRIS
jgi:hypothetical protein